MENTINQSKEVLELQKKLATITKMAKALLENSRPGSTPEQESVYICASVFLESELEKSV